MVNGYLKYGFLVLKLAQTALWILFLKKFLLLSEHVFNFAHCNFSCVRDLNAALNLAMALSSTVAACGLDNADVAMVKQEQK